MTLLISIHDVTPALARECEVLWALCERRGVVPALLVVPDWHGVAPLEASPDFVAWIRARAAQGAEIFLHGERHDEVGLPRTWRDELRAWGKTNREGEFLTLNGAAAAERMTRGLALFARLGLAPVGFVPPAWLATEEGFAAAGAVGLPLTEDDATIRLPSRGRRLPSPVLRWSARTPFRARASALVADAKWRLYRRAPLVRIALHPGDLAHAAAIRSIERTLDRWLADRCPVPYASLLAA
jgi:predicted deacetylase